MTERLPPMPGPLTPEERALAARLSRLGPHGEPSPALDARILAAARAGLGAEATPARKQARWPLALGIAASVALAVGLAWQLRPLPDPVAYDEAANAVGVAASAPSSVMQAEEAAASAPVPSAAPAEPLPREGFRRAPATVRETAAEQARAADTAADNAASDTRQERAYRAQPTPPPPPPAPPRVLQAPPVVEPEAGVAADVIVLEPPPAAPATQAAKAAAPAAPPSPQAMARDAASRRTQAAAAATEAGSARAAEATAQDTFVDEPFGEDIPPATADSPSVRDAWLHRIRELQAAGDTEAARASLQEFVRRYPDVPLPEDLRPLLD